MCRRRGGHKLLRPYSEVQAQLMRMDEQAETKDDRSLVTLADYAAQAIISWRIAQEWPDFTMVGEEDSEALLEVGTYAYCAPHDI